jgi:hypothetical protein
MTLPTSGLITVNDRGARAATTFGSVAAGGGNMVFIKKLTASSSGTLSFVDGTSSVVLDNTYKEYLFTFKDIHPGTQSKFSFNGSIDSGSNYNVTKTSTIFVAAHNEGDSDTALTYRTADDLAQGTGFQNFLSYGDNATDNDSCFVGSLRLFNPSSTTFVKHFIARTNSHDPTDYSIDSYVAGYFNTTSAIDAMQFKFSSGNIDTGDICLYGIL